MFKIIILILIIILIVYFLVKWYLSFKFYLTPGIKHKLEERDKMFFEKIRAATTGQLFYTTTKWNSRTNNSYILDTVSDRYYIVEPGYYYSTGENCKLFLSTSVKIYNFDHNNKIIYK